MKWGSISFLEFPEKFDNTPLLRTPLFNEGIVYYNWDMKEVVFVRVVSVIILLILVSFIGLVSFSGIKGGGEKRYEYIGDTGWVYDFEGDSGFYIFEITDSVEVSNEVEWGPTEFKMWNE